PHSDSRWTSAGRSCTSKVSSTVPGWGWPALRDSREGPVWNSANWLSWSVSSTGNARTSRYQQTARDQSATVSSTRYRPRIMPAALPLLECRLEFPLQLVLQVVLGGDLLAANLIGDLVQRALVIPGLLVQFIHAAGELRVVRVMDLPGLVCLLAQFH